MKIKKLALFLILATVLGPGSSLTQTTVTLVIKRPKVSFTHASVNTADSLHINTGAAFGITSDTTLTVGAQDTIVFMDNGAVRFKLLMADVPGDNEVITFDLATGIASWEAIPAGGAHNILSATHSDAETAAAVRGDVLVAQTASPEWRALVLGAAGQILRSDGTDLLYTTATYPTTTTINQLLFSSAANTIIGLATSNSQVLQTSAGGVPSFSATLPNAVQDNITRLGAIAVSVAWADGVKQTFNPDATNAGINVGAHTAQVSAPADGDVFYNSTANQMQGRINGSWVDLGAGAGGGETNTHSSDGGGLALTAATPKVGVDLRLVSLNAAHFDLSADLASIDPSIAINWIGVQTWARAGLAGDFQNSTDAISNEVVRLQGADRATAANNDESYIGLRLENDTAAQVEAVRLVWVWLDVADASKDSRPELHYFTSNTLRELSFPAITANDVVSTLGLAQTFTAIKTIAADWVNTANPWSVNEGGSGFATATDGGILLGSGTGAFTVLGVAANGQIPIGDGATDPVLATLTGAGTVSITNGPGSITVTGKAKDVNPTLTVENPDASEDISMFFTNRAITVTEMRAVLIGSATPSVTWTVRHFATDRNNAGNEVVTSGTVTTSTTAGSDVTSFNDATIPADSFVWFETTAKSGTVTEISVTVIYDVD